MAVTFAFALAFGSVVGAVLAQGAVRERDRAAEHARTLADADRLEGEVALVLARAGEVASRAGEGDAAFRAAARRAVDGGDVVALAVARPDGTIRSSVTAGPVAPLLDRGVGADPVLTDAIDAAAADGTARVAAPIELDAGPALVVVAPIRPSGTALSVAAQRAATNGTLVAVVPFADLLRPDDDVPLWSGADVELTTPTGTFGAAPGPVDASIEAGGSVWEVAVGPLPGVRRVLGWWVLGLGLLASVLVYVTTRRQHEQRRRAEDEAADRSRQLEMIAGTSASLQQSLELADLLPAFCVDVVDEFGLSSAAVLVADDAGNLLEAFRFGDPAAGDHPAEFELRRGWRAVGRLVVRAPAPLDDGDAQSLQALSDLLAVAVSNAHLYQREQQAVNRLSELDALKNAFLGTVSHELRTSTTAVQGFGELLTDHWETLPEERRRELATRIKRQAGSLRHLVDDLLDYARLEHQSLRVTPRSVALDELVSGLVDSMSPLVFDHEIVVDAEPVTAWVDPIAVERILANLLSNAGKYSPAGTRVTVTVELVGDRARVQVADQGPGIPAEERRRVFVRFYRLSNAETVRTRGAGIGLSILHDFAERSDALVTIDDAPGGGARIAVDFPTAPAEVGALAPEHA